MHKTKWRKQIDLLEIGDSVEIKPTMIEASLRKYIYGILAKKTGRKHSINKLTNKLFKVTRTL